LAFGPIVVNRFMMLLFIWNLQMQLNRLIRLCLLTWWSRIHLLLVLTILKHVEWRNDNICQLGKLHIWIEKGKKMCSSFNNGYCLEVFALSKRMWKNVHNHKKVGKFPVQNMYYTPKLSKSQKSKMPVKNGWKSLVYKLYYR
jgi:hypothetical protein